MKKEFLILTLTAFLVATCKSKKEQVEVQVTATPSTQDLLMTHAIHKDSANLMIGSYLESIDDSNGADLRSISFDADQLRFYLNDSTRGKIDRLKIMFAHTQEWIGNGNTGVPAGLKAGKLTVILAGYDKFGNYVYIGPDANHVLDYGHGCPIYCPSYGTSASHLLN